MVGRIDTTFNHPKYENALNKLKTNHKILLFGEYIDSISGGATPLRANEEQYTDSGIKFLRIQNIIEGGFDLLDVKFITNEVHNKLLKRSQLAENDLLMTITGRIGTCATVKKDILPANINQHIVRIRLKAGIDPSFIASYLNSDIGMLFSNRGVTGTTRIALDYEAIKSIPIPIISESCQNNLINITKNGLLTRSNKLQQANELLINFENQITKLFALENSEKRKTAFAIKFSQLDGVIDAKRYASQKTSKSSLKISDICEVLEKKVNVTNFGTDVIDWIRIDDLPNQPLDVEEFRTQPANEVTGSFFMVEENDILVARLGPTILNQKIVMVRSLNKATIASSEFLVLRCKPEYNPETVMSVLKTEYYKNLMYSHARGSTPSRYRLNREDIMKLPFPEIKDKQKDLAIQATDVRLKVKKMRVQAEHDWQAAREQFEKELLGDR